MSRRFAFLFPGQASQYVGMGKAFYEGSDVARGLYDRASEILDYDLKRVSFEGPEKDLKKTSVTQPAVFVHSLVAYEALRETGVSSTIVAGHSVGECAALYAAEVFGFEEGLKLVAARGRAMEAAGARRTGTMAAIIGLDAEQVAGHCSEVPGTVFAANLNAPEQIVISGEVEAVRSAMKLAKSRGAKRAIELAVSGAFHTELMAPAVEFLRPVLEGIRFSRATLPIVSNTTAQPETKPERLKDLFLKQLTCPVLWHASVRRIVNEGVREMIEVGPGNVLKGLARRIDPEIRVTCVAGPEDLEALSKAA